MQDANTRQLDPLSGLGHAHECFMLCSRNYITCNQCVGLLKYFLNSHLGVRKYCPESVVKLLHTFQPRFNTLVSV